LVIVASAAVAALAVGMGAQAAPRQTNDLTSLLAALENSLDQIDLG
jgi:hypothetical protein